MMPPPGAPAFLRRHGWGGATIAPLAGDASFRRYFRVERGGTTAVLMDAPPPEDVRPFVAVAAHLAAIGLSVPAIHAAEPDRGLLLIEDLGDLRLAPTLAAAPEHEAALYALALDALAVVAHAPPPTLPRYDWAAFAREAVTFVDWYLPAQGIAADPDSFLAAWQAALAPVLDAPPDTMVLLDYHADNLMWLPDRDGVRAVGLLDFQDARLGHPAYDLVSLLRDARRDVAPSIEAAALAARDAPFRAAYEILGAQRDTKILGYFARLWKRDGKPAYLAHMPRVWRYLEHELAHPALAPVAAWMDAHVPAAARAAAWARPA